MTTTSNTDDLYLRSISASDAGLDEAKLDQMKKWLVEWKMTTAIILREDAIAWEWYSAGEDTVGPLLSCTKSLLSALVGIAIAEGNIQSVEATYC